MVANGAKGTSTRDRRKRLTDGQVGIDLPNRLEIEQGCLLYVYQKTFDNGIYVEEDRTFWCRIVVLHASHIVSGIDDKLLTDLRDNSTSIVVLCYEGSDRLPLNKDTVVCIDMHLNWLSKQLVKNDIPKTSLLAGFLSGNEVTHIDKQIAVSQEATFDLVNHVKNNDGVAKYFLLKHYFYKLMAQCINRMLMDRSRLLNNDDLDFVTKEKKISKAVAAMDHSLQRKFPGVGELAFISGMSVSSFLEKFYAVYNETPFEYFRKKQMDLAVTLLKKGLSIKYIAYNLGYQDPANFSRAFKNFYGMSPKQYNVNGEL